MKADSFCSGKRRPLRGVLEYIAWHGWSRDPHMLTDAQKEVFSTGFVCFLWKTIDQAIQIVTLPQTASPSGLCFAAAGKIKHVLQP